MIYLIVLNLIAIQTFADDTSLFSVTTDSLRSSNLLNIDRGLIKDWAFQWKMLFNPHLPRKQLK